MTKLLDPVTIQQSVRVLSCERCGAEAHATCSCGVAYVPKAERAAAAIAEDPTKSDRAIAAEIGVSPTTVGKVRDQVSSVDSSPPERIGRNGKTYTMRKRQPAPPREVRYDLINQAIDICKSMDIDTRAVFAKQFAAQRQEWDVIYW